LFRNRGEGHLAVSRQFRTDLDYVELGPNPELIAPGLGAGLDSFAKPNDEKQPPRSVARRLVREATPGAPRARGFNAVLTAYEATLESTPAPAADALDVAPLPLDRLPGRSWLDLAIIEGVYRHGVYWHAERALEAVRSALICGPVTLRDLELAFADREQAQRAIRRLVAAAAERPGQFDAWLKGVREHSFLALLAGTGLRATQRAEAAEQARRLYCALLWKAYLGMARCYGALMFLAYIDLCLHSERAPDEGERWLFRQRHFPQVCLGLPLAFFPRAQLRWIIRLLTRRWREWDAEPASHDRVTDMLGLFGQLVRARRDADRRAKPAGPSAAPAEVIESVAAADVSQAALADDEEDGLLITSRFCPRCHAPLELSGGDVGRAGEALRFNAYCDGCIVERTYRLRPADFGSTTEPA